MAPFFRTWLKQKYGAIEKLNDAWSAKYASFDEVGVEPVTNWNDPAEGNLSGLERDVLLGSDAFASPKEVCPFPFYTLAIHSDLRVSVCCVDWAKQAVVGDLRTQTLTQIWHGEELHAFRLAHIRRQRATLAACRDCTFLHTARDNMDAATERSA